MNTCTFTESVYVQIKKDFAMRKLTTRFAAVVVAFIAMFAFCLPAFAAPPPNFSSTIKPGSFGVVASGMQGDVGNITITPQLTSYEAYGAITIDDLSGTQAGWNVRLTGGNLINGANFIPVSFKWDALTKASIASTSPSTAIAGSAAPNAAIAGLSLYQANATTGMGEFTSNVRFDYQVGPSTLVGTYAAAESLSMTSGPA